MPANYALGWRNSKTVRPFSTEISVHAKYHGQGYGYVVSYLFFCWNVIIFVLVVSTSRSVNLRSVCNHIELGNLSRCRSVQPISSFHHKMWHTKNRLLPEQFTSLLLVVACLADSGGYLFGWLFAVFFVCGWDTVARKLWGQRCERGQEDFLNNYYRRVYFDLSFCLLFLKSEQSASSKLSSTCLAYTYRAR